MRGPTRLEPSLTRRQALAAGLATGATLLAGCGSKGPDTAGWTFVDDRGQRVRLGKRPTRVAAYISAAAALYGWGVTPAGVFGGDPRDDPALARFPWNASEIVGSVYGEIDTAKLLALGIELIVSRWYPPPRNTPLFGFRDLAQQKRIASRVPIVGLSGKETSTTQIDRFGDLARALGADTSAPTITRARTAFVRAQDRLSRIARRKSNLRIIAVSGDQSTMYVAKLADSGDLTFFKRHGVPLVSARTPDVYWDRFGWDHAAKYPADGILYDARSLALPLGDAKAIPAFAALPAVRANQIARWQVDPPPSYQEYTAAMNALARAIAGWHRVI
jgi:iron complex transport system substrate-binding protein